MVLGRDGLLRLIDFEFATRTRDARTCCTLQFAAPEVIRAQRTRQPYAGQNADLYSLGMSFLTLFLGPLPYPAVEGKVELKELTQEEAADLIAGAVAYSDAQLGTLPPGGLRLLRGLLKQEPDDRTPAHVAAKNRWLDVAAPLADVIALIQQAAPAAASARVDTSPASPIATRARYLSTKAAQTHTQVQESPLLSDTESIVEVSFASPRTPAPPGMLHRGDDSPERILCEETPPPAATLACSARSMAKRAHKHHAKGTFKSAKRTAAQAKSSGDGKGGRPAKVVSRSLHTAGSSW